jgi:uncharacterized protein (DUF1501 family)
MSFVILSSGTSRSEQARRGRSDSRVAALLMAGYLEQARMIEHLRRRELIKAIAAGAVLLGARPLRRFFGSGSAAAATPTRPRFYLQIIADGGLDAIYSMDPKTTRDVDHGIDVPYPAKDIVEAGNVRVGPAFKSLAHYAQRIAVVNSFHQNSANHQSGMVHVTRCKSRAAYSTPSLLEILGLRHDGIATGAMHIGPTFESVYSPKFIGETATVGFGDKPGLFAHVDKADPDDLRQAALALRREAKSLGTSGASGAERTTGDNLAEAADFLAAVADAPRFAPVAWKHPREGDFDGGKDLQRALWLVENKLARCVAVYICHRALDTHVWNGLFQPDFQAYIAFLLGRLFDELDHRTVDGSRLSRQTVVFAGSEIGRFPRLNAGHGKDHFPQASVLFFGNQFAAGSFGATGRNMETLPISLTTGREDAGGHVLRVDDIGTTLLGLDGVDPQLYGYTGNHLSFLTG